MSAAKISLRGVHKSFGAHSVLNGIDMDIAGGTVVSLIGPSGSGKSTAVQLLLGLQQPKHGRVLINGHDLQGIPLEQYWAGTSAVFQDSLLFHASIADNIRYGRPGATDEEVEAAARVANAHEFVSRFPESYATKVGERGVQLSGGQKQRVAIARMLMQRPAIILADEPDASLDPQSGEDVMRLLSDLARQDGLTLLFISHRMEHTLEFSDQRPSFAPYFRA